MLGIERWICVMDGLHVTYILLQMPAHLGNSPFIMIWVSYLNERVFNPVTSLMASCKLVTKGTHSHDVQVLSIVCSFSKVCEETCMVFRQIWL